jgi:hypothetical protein
MYENSELLLVYRSIGFMIEGVIIVGERHFCLGALESKAWTTKIPDAPAL